MKEHWGEISATAKSVFDDLKGIVTSVISAVQGLWSKFGENIKSVAEGAWDFIKNTFITP